MAEMMVPHANAAGRVGTDMQYQKIADRINAARKPDENGILPPKKTVKDVEDAINAGLPYIDQNGQVHKSVLQFEGKLIKG